MSSELDDMAVVRTCPKLCGGDIELGNFIVGPGRSGDTTFQASGLILSRIDGLPRRGRRLALPSSAGDQHSTRSSSRYWSSSAQDTAWYSEGGQQSASGVWRQYYAACEAYSLRDYARRWLPNGGCIYGDLGHVEVAIPEVTSAIDAVTYFHAMLRIVREAAERANLGLDDDEKVVVTANNSDGHGRSSWGGHLNFALTSECYRNIFERRLHHALFLASYLVSSVIFTGAGKVGSENGRPPAPFELTQRGDFYETFIAPQTTYARPLVNSRDEPLTAYGSGIARLHCIFFDTTLCHGSSLLKWGATQLVLAMIEQGVVPVDLILDDPLTALVAWNQDPKLEARARLISGASYTAAEMQLAILEHVRRFVDAGHADDTVPHARDILAYWEDTVEKLQSKDWDSLRSRVEWILKRSVLERAIERRGLDWTSPAVKHLDHTFSSLDPDEGLYWAYERAGAVERLVAESDIQRAVSEPPGDTRAWLRGAILSHPEADAIDSIDWDRVTYRAETRFGLWPRSRVCTLVMGNPLQFTREDCEDIVARADSLEEVLRALGADDSGVDRHSASRGVVGGASGGGDSADRQTQTYPLAQSTALTYPVVVDAWSERTDWDQSEPEEASYEATTEET